MSQTSIQEDINKLTDELNRIEVKINNEENKSGKIDIKYINELDKKCNTIKTKLHVLTSYSKF